MVTTLAPCWYCSGLIRQFASRGSSSARTGTSRAGSTGSGGRASRSPWSTHLNAWTSWNGSSRSIPRSGTRTSARTELVATRRRPPGRGAAGLAICRARLLAGSQLLSAACGMLRSARVRARLAASRQSREQPNESHPLPGRLDRRGRLHPQHPDYLPLPDLPRGPPSYPRLVRGILAQPPARRAGRLLQPLSSLAVSGGAEARHHSRDPPGWRREVQAPAQLDGVVIAIDHIGSTAVPGLACRRPQPVTSGPPAPLTDEAGSALTSAGSAEARRRRRDSPASTLLGRPRSGAGRRCDP